jgi:5-methylthioadenosine/S-adenosylhomocysteine deaminase
MTSLLIKNIFLNGRLTDVFIDKQKFCKIAPLLSVAADLEIDGKDKALIPPFYNMHTHTGMNLLRGFSDDKPLMDWLQKDIWPAEDKLTEEDVIASVRLSVLEMIKSGTVFFCDMYSHQSQTMKVVADMGIRAFIPFAEMDFFDEKERISRQKKTLDYLKLPNPAPDRILKGLACHSIYTVSEELFRWTVEKCQENGLFLHIHAAETQTEEDECRQKYGCSVIDRIQFYGALTNKTILAHSVYVSPKDSRKIAKSGACVVTCPCSNMKLASGLFPFQQMKKEGVCVTIGTDSTASNNNLNMLEEMKFAALSAKIQSGDSSAASAEDVFRCAVLNAPCFFGINAGKIEQGAFADCLLIDLNNVSLVPNYNLVSNLVYSAGPECVHSVICNGRLIMQDRKVFQEEEILRQASACSEKFKKEI